MFSIILSKLQLPLFFNTENDFEFNAALKENYFKTE